MKQIFVIIAASLLLATGSNGLKVITSADDTDRLLVMPHHQFVINCSLDDSDAPDVLVVSWYRSAEGGERVKLTSTERLKTSGDALVFVQPSPMEDPANYTCSFDVPAPGGRRPEATVQVIANVTVKMPGISVNKVQGEDLLIHCKIRGKPWPTVHWTKDAHHVSAAIADAATRLHLEADDLGFPDAVLSLTALRRPEDGGDYCCHAESVANAAIGCIIVRVKDKYGALWPVIGIAAELLLLAAIIVFSESRKPKPVIEDPTAESEPDNTAPAAGQAADVRQRK